MIRIEILAGEHVDKKNVQLDDLDSLIRDPQGTVWIDLVDPSPADFELLAREFAFHPLALEDAQSRHQRPKLDQYESFLFIVFYAARVDSSSYGFAVQEIELFVGPNYLVTVHQGVCDEISETAQRWRQNTQQLGAAGIAVLLYSLLDSIVDHYFPVLDEIAERTDQLESAIFDYGNRDALQQIFQLRKSLLALRRVLSPERDLMSTLTRRDIELLGPDTAVYFQDIYDHVLRVTDAIDTYRDLLSGALDAYLSVVSNNLNQVMRTLTSWSIILMTLAAIAGIYGMNFHNMPELRYHYGYFFALGAMALIAGSLFALFKRIRWL
jgi:magnesium transporter